MNKFKDNGFENTELFKLVKELHLEELALREDILNKMLSDNMEKDNK